MDIAIREQDIDFVAEYITRFEVNQLINLIQENMSYTTIGEIILGQCNKTKKGYRPNENLKVLMNNFVRSFPKEYIAQKGLNCEAKSEKDLFQHIRKEHPELKLKEPFQGPTDSDIHEIWKKKRKEKKDIEKQIITGSICLKRKEIPNDIIMYINKKLKKKH